MKTSAMSSPLCLGVTGGIGSGKSFVCKMLERHGVPVFYTDDEAKAEMSNNADIHRDLCTLLGSRVLDTCGKPVKAVLSQYICHSTSNAQRVNDIVHPRVKTRAMRWLSSASVRHSPVAAIECALLFEAGFDSLCRKTLTVSAPLQTRIDRICRRDGITPQKAMEWIDLQMPQEEKARLSDYVIYNDGEQDVRLQVNQLVNSLLLVHRNSEFSSF